MKTAKKAASQTFQISESAFVVFSFFASVLLPFLLWKLSVLSLAQCAFFLGGNGLLAFAFARAYLAKRDSSRIAEGDIEEKSNVLRVALRQEVNARAAFLQRIKRYDTLKHIIEELNVSLDPDAIATSICSIAFTQVAREKGVCSLYLVDPKNARLNLYKTMKSDPAMVIKSKEGDLFDIWVSRHMSALFVEDAKKDFRFDPERFPSEARRAISSLVSAPLITHQHFIGLLRIDNPAPNFFSLDDSRFLMTICDLSAVAFENSQLFQKTQDLAIHDELTGLFTKGYFNDRLSEELSRCRRGGTSLSVLMLDIDHFKEYNDKFGHSAGDIVLKNLTVSMNDFFAASPGAILCRFGGEEFCVALLDTNKDQAVALAVNFCSRIEKNRVVLRRQETRVTVSIGVASCPPECESADALLSKADHSLYAAKQAGRNRVVAAH